jgi:hypothetical protein
MFDSGGFRDMPSGVLLNTIASYRERVSNANHFRGRTYYHRVKRYKGTTVPAGGAAPGDKLPALQPRCHRRMRGEYWLIDWQLASVMSHM